MRVQFAVVAGPHQGQVFSFSGHDTFLVGRSKQAHFRLPQNDRYFSRIHFLVEVNPPSCRLLDMGSRNGTYVNKQKVAAADLKDGDLIKGGRTIIRVTVEDTDSEAGRQCGAAAPPPVPPGEPYRLATAEQGPAPPLSLPPLPTTGTACCAVCAAAAPEPQPGNVTLCVGCQREIASQEQLFPGYWVVRKLGQGGMGVVYLVLRRAEGDLAALKTIVSAADADEREVARFLREAAILKQLRHPHIVAQRDAGSAGGQLYFVMDYVRGSDAARLLAEVGPLPVGRAVTLVCQVLDALAYAHSKGFVHRDIKPANLLVAQVEGRDLVKVADFGLARAYQESKLSGLTLAGSVGGTVPFMAPEQITNFREAKPAVDQYAAAATLYHLLTAKYVHDFPREVQKRLLKILQEDAVPIRQRRPDLPEPLAAVVHCALAREPENRFADAQAFRAALARFCG